MNQFAIQNTVWNYHIQCSLKRIDISGKKTLSKSLIQSASAVYLFADIRLYLDDIEEQGLSITALLLSADTKSLYFIRSLGTFVDSLPVNICFCLYTVPGLSSFIRSKFMLYSMSIQ